jgi:predicted house-cleaning noncanonical NTP pyrophosphatase (MazG superfamily)
MKEHYKLVRDNIPKIIESCGRKCETRILENGEFLAELNKKLIEETVEYIQSGDVMELVDIEEVLLAIIETKKVSKKRFEDLRKIKEKERGAYKNRVYLISSEEHGKSKE